MTCCANPVLVEYADLGKLPRWTCANCGAETDEPPLERVTPAMKDALREMVEEWVNEGHTIPPYDDAVYDVLEWLDLCAPEGEYPCWVYDTRRPK